MVGELKNGEITEYEIHPEDFGFTMASNRALRVETPEASRAMLMGVLDNSDDPAVRAAIDIVVLNAGAALYAANVCADIGAGIARAREAIESGAAAKKLADFKIFAAAPATVA
jgi:anthranilate phosphoribosyltransferase